MLNDEQLNTVVYNAMAGLPGYLPAFSCIVESRDDAIDVLADIHDLPDNLRDDLANSGVIYVNINVYGNTIIQIEPVFVRDLLDDSKIREFEEIEDVLEYVNEG